MEEPQELETLAKAKRSDAALSEVERSILHDRDQQDLARLGKRQVLKVRPIDRNSCYVHMCLSVPAELWLHVNVGF